MLCELRLLCIGIPTASPARVRSRRRRAGSPPPPGRAGPDGTGRLRRASGRCPARAGDMDRVDESWSGVGYG